MVRHRLLLPPPGIARSGLQGESENLATRAFLIARNLYNHHGSTSHASATPFTPHREPTPDSCRSDPPPGRAGASDRLGRFAQAPEGAVGGLRTGPGWQLGDVGGARRGGHDGPTRAALAREGKDLDQHFLWESCTRSRGTSARLSCPPRTLYEVMYVASTQGAGRLDLRLLGRIPQAGLQPISETD